MLQKIKETAPEENNNKKEMILNNSDISKELVTARDKFLAKFFNDLPTLDIYLRQNYPDFYDYRYYHLVIGSTVGKGECSKKDFPGDDSIEKMLKEERFPELKVDGEKIVMVNRN